MKASQFTILVLALCMAAISANAQTLTRSLMLKPAGSATTATIDLTANPTSSWSLDFPDGSLAANGPFMKVSVAAGNKAVSFGQVTLSSNGAAGDVTGILGVSNGGTGLATIPVGAIMVGNGTSALTTLTSSTNGQFLSIVGGVPAWSTTLGGGGATTNISASGAGNTTNINTAPATGGTTTIGNATSTTSLLGTVTFGVAPTIPLPQNNIWVGNASGNQAAFPPATNSVLTTNGVAGGTPVWVSTLPIATGGTNSNATPTNGGVAYGNGTQYQFTTVGTAGQVLQSNGAAAPTWVNVNTLIAGITAQYTVLAADQTNGFATITPSITGYSATSKIIVTYQSASGPAQAASVSNQAATTFRVYSGAMTTGDVINYIIVN